MKPRIFVSVFRFLSPVLLAVAFFETLPASATAEDADALVLVDEGQSAYVIAWAEEADERLMGLAVDLLRSTIAEATGVELPVYAESEAPEGVPTIYLGRTSAAREAGLPVDEVQHWEYLIRAVGPDIFLVGEEYAGQASYWNSGQHSGTLNAVTAFLERVAGVRFVLPGTIGRHVPRLDCLAVEPALDLSWSPLFPYMIGRRVARGSYIDPYALANNFPAVIGFNHGKRFFAGGSHTWDDYVPAETYFETHPEYFRLDRHGNRSSFRNILCISNPEVHELLLKGMEEKMDEGYDMVMLGQSDGYIECACDDCQAIHPDMGEKIWIVHRMLAEEMNRRRPDKQVVLLSYVTATKPPMTFDTFPENVVIMNNRYVPEYFQAWTGYEDVPKMVYIPKWLGRYRYGSPRYAVDLVRLWLENSVIGIYFGGGLDCTSGSGWGLYGPRYYAFGQALKDPTRCADELEREYVDASFGAAAGPMREFFSLLHRRAEFLSLLDRRGMGMPDRRFRGHPFSTKPADMHAHILAPEIIRQMSAALERAKRLVEEEDEKVTMRLALIEGEFGWLRSIAMMQHMLRAYRLAPGPNALNLVEAMVAERRETMERFDEIQRSISGPGNILHNFRRPFHHNPPGMPDDGVFGWDFEAIRESGEYPTVDVSQRIRGGQLLPPFNLDPATLERLRDRTAPAREEDVEMMEEDTIRAPFDM